ncbi:hypothetical protein ACVWZM_002937 [Bradyrhizobium sp. USDA 4501]
MAIPLKLRLRRVDLLPLKREPNEGYVCTGESTRHICRDGFAIRQNKEALAVAIPGSVVTYDLPDRSVERLPLAARLYLVDCGNGFALIDPHGDLVSSD